MTSPTGKETTVANLARMPGRVSPPWCPHCKGPPGPDCPDRSRSPRQIRRGLKRDLAREVRDRDTPSTDE
jgi:hypothetical protein